jgi:uncharacterized protein
VTSASYESFRVALPAGTPPGAVSARLYRAPAVPTAWLILAPGAGAGQGHPFMVHAASELSRRGCSVATFDFPYVERGRRAPDPRGVLEACWVAVLEAVREQAGPAAAVVAGGKSMGGRIASQVAADPHVAAHLAGLVFLGYPLHPPGKPGQRRTTHWPQVHLPALFVQGTRDPFASPEELRESLPDYAGRSEVMLVEGGDHSFAVPHKANRDRTAVMASIHDRIAAWIEALPAIA